MTPDEAKECWCPYSRVSFDEGAQVPVWNRDVVDQSALNCLSARCAVWRWSRGKETAAYLDAVQAYMKTSGANFNVATQKVWADVGSTFEKTDGYCGLAGKPE